jgi:AcrR family transcriptional regulator
MPRPRQSEEHRDLVRQRILTAAQDLFHSAGIDAVSMRAVGARVGLTASALYAYFPAKLDLVRALSREALDELDDRMRATSQREADPIAAIRALGTVYAEFALEDPARFHVVFMLDRSSMAEQLKSAEMGRASYSVLRERVTEGIRQGRLRLADPDLTAQTLWAGLHGVLNLIDSCSNFPLLSSPLLVITMIDTLLTGLQANPPKE